MASKRSSAMTTRRKSTGVRKASGGKKRSATPYIVGGVAVAAVVGLLLWSRKSSAATPPATPPGPTTSYTALQQAALNANKAQEAAGYYVGNVPYYQALQSAAGLTADGYPGTNTYNALVAALASIVPPVAPSSNWIPAYSFASATGWDGIHAPTSTQLLGSSYTGPTTMDPTASVPSGVTVTPI